MSLGIEFWVILGIVLAIGFALGIWCGQRFNPLPWDAIFKEDDLE